MQTPGSDKTTELLQRAKVVNEAATQWSLSPKVGVYLPLGITYLVLDCAPDYSYTVVGVPDRSYIWIMGREQQMDAKAYDVCLKRAKQCGYDTTKIARVVHDTRVSPSPSAGENGAAEEAPAERGASGVENAARFAAEAAVTEEAEEVVFQNPQWTEDAGNGS
eukprot:FR738273.1.p1 GENE.FR738273.1~~FR738273.1.p1  ORF type:complete len:189 (+),score=24.91 FR738273.1:81-569(+)